MHHIDADKTYREKGRWELHQNASNYFQKIQEATPHKTATVQPLTSHLKNHLNKTNKTCETLLEKQGRTNVTFFCGPLHIDVQVLVDQQELICQLCADTGCSLEDLPGVIDDRDGWKERKKERKKERERKRESKKSVLSMQLDDEEDKKSYIWAKIVDSEWHTKWMTYTVNDIPSEWHTQWMTYRVNDIHSEWHTKRMTYTVNDIPSEWHTQWMTYRVNDIHSEWHTKWMSYTVNDILSEWHTQWMTYRVNDIHSEWHTMWMTYTVNDILSEWHTKWMTYTVNEGLLTKLLFRCKLGDILFILCENFNYIALIKILLRCTVFTGYNMETHTPGYNEYRL